MIAKPPHNRKLGLNGVALTKQRNNPNDIKALTAIRDEIEKIIIDSDYLGEADFSWVTVAVRYGLKNDNKPNYQVVSKKYGDLPLSIEVDARELIDISFEELKLVFKKAVLTALVHAGRKFEQPVEMLEQESKKIKIGK